MTKQEKVTSLAEYILFGKNKTTTTIAEYMNKLGLEFRKGKDVSHINHAVKKALNPKRGRGKVEFELSMLSAYLEVDIVKEIKQTL